MHEIGIIFDNIPETSILWFPMYNQITTCNTGISLRIDGIDTIGGCYVVTLEMLWSLTKAILQTGKNLRYLITISKCSNIFIVHNSSSYTFNTIYQNFHYSIHDHTDAHCFVKILDGSLLETKYDWPKIEGEEEPLSVIERNIYDTNGVSYMSDKLGLHRMENPSHSDGAVSLHLYIPPYETCNAFDERTGKKTKCLVTFFTEYGKKAENVADNLTAVISN
uniref:Cysteine dioxygenase n=1 Tax=Heterorhabditis bacteriophora TaxID=37862 RepID=A0A1I7WFD6_HETBA